MLMGKNDFASWTKALDRATADARSLLPLNALVRDAKDAIEDGTKARDTQGVAFLRDLLQRAEAALAARVAS